MNFRLSVVCLICMAVGAIVADLGLPPIYIVIRSQPNSYHAEKAIKLQKNIMEQIKEAEADHVKVYQTHRKWRNHTERTWALLPIMANVARLFEKEDGWVMFIEDTTKLKVSELVDFLSYRKPLKEQILARTLYDSSISGIHDSKLTWSRDKTKPFLYPDFEAGWVVSSEMVRKMARQFRRKPPEKEFVYDLPYEIGKFVLDAGVEVTDVLEFCGAGEENLKCVTNVNKKLPKCGNKIDIDNIFVAVKTTQKFHKTRMKVVKKTWSRKVKHVTFYSNVTDKSIPTVDVGVPNVQKGHCEKLDVILRDFQRRATNNIHFLLITDDDTTVGVSRLIKLLNCYDPNEKMILGEKNGYLLFQDHDGFGFTYIAGGGGIVLTKPAVEAWIKDCKCPVRETPDDQYLSLCLLRSSGIVSTHCPMFHSARPDDYAVGYINNQNPITFHNHTKVEPDKIYWHWFGEEDSELKSYRRTSRPEDL